MTDEVVDDPAAEVVVDPLDMAAAAAAELPAAPSFAWTGPCASGCPPPSVGPGCDIVCRGGTGQRPKWPPSWPRPPSWNVRMLCSALYAKVSEKWGCVWYRWDCLLEPASG
uniref:(northern house mosquito) hypothetical protein n=1 Tax=Culex pipiens TaxID=7175 RepID=A0A8D8ASF2_CULPI